MTAKVFHADCWGLRQQKYDWLLENDVATTKWTELKPETPYYLFVPQDTDVKKEFEEGWRITDAMPVFSLGIVTARDHLTLKWSKDEVWQTVNGFVALDQEKARQKYDLGADAEDWTVVRAQQDLTAAPLTKDKIQPVLYRPFDTRLTYYTGRSRGFICRPRGEVMSQMIQGRNIGLITTRQTRDEWGVIATTSICAHKSCAAYDSNSLLPLYCYPSVEEQTDMFESSPWPISMNGRRPNLVADFVQEFTDDVQMEFKSDGKGDLQKTFGPEDILAYMYAIFYSPAYRQRYAEFLKIDFPRVPLTSNADLFRELCRLGEELIGLHLMEKHGPNLVSYPAKGDNVVEKVRYTEPNEEEGTPGRVWINKTQYFEGVPTEVWEFHIGGYQVCEKWLKDRKGRELSYDDLTHYQHIVSALSETMRLMDEIDAVIEEHGGWPLK